MYFAERGDLGKAEAEFDAALLRNPDYIEALLGLAWLKLDQWTQDPQEAGPQVLRDVDELGARVATLTGRSHGLAPVGGQAWFYRATARKRLGDYPGAIEAFKEAIRRFKQTREIEVHESASYSNLGAVYLSTGQFDDAKNYLSKGAERLGQVQNPEAASAWRNLAAFELFQRNPAASEHIEKALAADWNDSLSWVLRAHLRLERGGAVELSQALDDAKHADTEAHFKSPRAKRVRALAHLRNEQLREAIRNAEEAIALEDMPTVNHLIIAIARARIGNRTGAQESLDSAESGWPADLREPGAYDATLGSGDLWIDTADELIRLREEANAVLAAPAP